VDDKFVGCTIALVLVLCAAGLVSSVMYISILPHSTVQSPRC